MTKIEIWQWFKQRIASEYNTNVSNISLANAEPNYMPQELAIPDLETVFGTFVVEVIDSTGAIFRPSYGFYQKKTKGQVGMNSLKDEYYPGGDHTNTRKIKDEPETSDILFLQDAESYLDAQGLITYTDSVQIIKRRAHISVQAIHTGRDWSTLGFGTVSVVDKYHVWCDDWTGAGTGTWHVEKMKSGKTVSVMQTASI